MTDPFYLSGAVEGALVHGDAAFLLAQMLPRDQAAERLDRASIGEPSRGRALAAIDAITRAGRAWKEAETSRSEQERAGASTDTDRVGDALQAGGDGSEFLTYPQVAARLGVHESTVRRRVRSGDLRAVAFGRARRIARSELDRYLATDPDQELTPCPDSP